MVEVKEDTTTSIIEMKMVTKIILKERTIVDPLFCPLSTYYPMIPHCTLRIYF